MVGNPIVDTLRLTLRKLAGSGEAAFLEKFPAAGHGRKLLLVTLHRRESFGRPLEDICAAVRRLAEARGDVELCCPVHPNPTGRDPVRRLLTGAENIHLLEPLIYPDFIGLLARATLVLSDSGGVLEEAETLGLPVLVTREVTERVEALTAGNARLVGCDADRIFAEAARLLAATPAPPDPRRPLRHTFGDGNTARSILRIVREHSAAQQPT